MPLPSCAPVGRGSKKAPCREKFYLPCNEEKFPALRRLRHSAIYGKGMFVTLPHNHFSGKDIKNREEQTEGLALTGKNKHLNIINMKLEKINDPKFILTTPEMGNLVGGAAIKEGTGPGSHSYAGGTVKFSADCVTYANAGDRNEGIANNINYFFGDSQSDIADRDDYCKTIRPGDYTAG